MSCKLSIIWTLLIITVIIPTTHSQNMSNITDGGGGGGGVEGGEVDEETKKRGCVPLPPPGSPPAPLGRFQPCPPDGPSTEEPIPFIRYKGRLQWDEICESDEKIAEIQRRGQSRFSPSPGDIEKGLQVKREEIESKTCDRTNGLGCFEIPLASGSGGVENRCRCTAAFGQTTSQRLQIQGKCYIPASKGQSSECFYNETGFPLPTGDTLDPKEFNPLTLPCVPNSVCRLDPSWRGKRCACTKGAILQDNGTCDKGSELIPWKFLVFMCVIFHSHFYATFPNVNNNVGNF